MSDIVKVYRAPQLDAQNVSNDNISVHRSCFQVFWNTHYKGEIPSIPEGADTILLSKSGKIDVYGNGNDMYIRDSDDFYESMNEKLADGFWQRLEKGLKEYNYDRNH